MNNAPQISFDDNKADPTTLWPNRETVEDTYFLDQNLALKIALQQNMILVDNQQQLQQCYYDGTPFKQAPANLIFVPVNEFTTFFSAGSKRIPTYLYNNNQTMSKQALLDQQTAFNEIIEDVRQVRNMEFPCIEQQEEFKDCYFFDRNLALKTAKQQNRVTTMHPSITGLQICYYDGDLIENGPENFINAKFKDILSFLSNTRLRYPSRVIYPAQASPAQQSKITELFDRAMKEANSQREQLAGAYLARIRTQQAAYHVNEPLRIYLRANRLTTVMQYVAKNIAKAVESLGHLSKLSVEHNDMEILHNMWHYKQQYEFNPHIVININQLNNHYLHPNTVNIIWWQDPMPALKKMQPLHWRERDVVFSVTPLLDKYLTKCGAKNIQRQLFCTDTSIFKCQANIKRENKVIFVGSSYISHVTHKARNMKKNAEIIQELNLLMEQGIAINETTINHLANHVDMDFDHIFWNLYHIVVRNKTVEWLCQYSKIPVEIYGDEWEFNPVVQPFYKGSLQHGEDLVKAYNAAKYALVAHPFEVNSQRLNEVTACGCIPLVFDCRHSAEQPHWDNHLLYFKTRDDLYKILDNNAGSPAPHIGEHFDYESLVTRIIRIAKSLYQTPSM
ncbi:MAG: hypothetical protein GXP08_11660 [Gammaproteobacteria bacterium]|nr:hypothetical protein [Gammaproteobacteria bacterium]